MYRSIVLCLRSKWVFSFCRTDHRQFHEGRQGRPFSCHHPAVHFGFWRSCHIYHVRITLASYYASICDHVGLVHNIGAKEKLF